VNEHHEDRSVEIRSTQGRRSLRFHSLHGDYFTASIEGDGPQATQKIWGYTDCQLLVQLFESIARDWTGWQGERAWESIEGDLRLEITSRSTGQITIRVALRNYGEDGWNLQALIFTEAGQLEGIARQVASFFR
jgi:hypothetical protein